MTAKLDPRHETDRLFLHLGAVLGTMPKGDTRERECWNGLWKLIPFIKALAVVGEMHPDELVAAWKMALVAPMPFGEPPIGLPKEEAESPP